VVPLEINRLDVASSPDQYRVIAGAIYDSLLKREIRYAFERYHPSEALQAIRTPAEIVEAPREGTCLDLAALFCGLCEAYELLPLLIVINGHALAAVSLTNGVREWNGPRPAAIVQRDGTGRVAVGGVAHKPWRVEAAEAEMPRGAKAVVAQLLAGARTTHDNVFKPPLVERLPPHSRPMPRQAGE